MAVTFPPDTRFLAYCGQVKGRRLSVSVPAWAHRVTAPIIPRRGLDLFQRVILGLSQAGVRSPDRVGQLTQLHPRLCAYIADQCQLAGLLDDYGEVTALGADALQTGMIDPNTEWSVRYVFSDPRTGKLWPRMAERLTDAIVLRASRDQVVLELGLAGQPDRVRALRMSADPKSLQPPAPEQVLEVARRDRQARLNARAHDFARRHNLTPLADLEEDPAALAVPMAVGEQLPELSRVASIGDPEPVEILGLIQAPGIDAPGQGWIAHDPFGAGTSDMFGELITLWLSEGGAFADQLGTLMAEQGAKVRSDHAKGMHRARSRADAELIKEFGADLRADPRVFDRLRDLQLASYEPDRQESAGAGMWAAFSLFEELFFRLAHAYPMPDEKGRLLAARAVERDAEKRRRQAAKNSTDTRGTAKGSMPPLVWARETTEDVIRKAAESVGVHNVPKALLDIDSDNLGRLAADPESGRQGNYRTALAICLISAGSRDDHPLRTMVAEWPGLLPDIDALRQRRNGQAHRLGTGSVVDDLQWCRDLTALAARQLLRLPATRGT